jgi:branched-chain amino acid transport system substrate-binding protein
MGKAPSAETIKIGVCGDIDNLVGKAVWRGAVLAAEQINAEGGVLGRNLTIVAEDDDSETPPTDIAVSNNAFTKLITVDDAAFVIDSGGGDTFIPHMDIAAEHHKIIFDASNLDDKLAQRVLDNYDKYKYFFRVKPNMTSFNTDMLNSILTVGTHTGFTKVAILTQDVPPFRATVSVLNSSLSDNGFDIVYSGAVPLTTTDFTSYFAAIDASGAQILVPIIATQAGASFVKEYTERQSSFVVWGLIVPATDNGFWNLTEGKCNYVSYIGEPVVAGYPISSKTLPFREAFINRWGVAPTGYGASAFDLVHFILPDAIKRAGTAETEAVVKALETTNIETSRARSFMFTSSHDVMVGATGFYFVFQWQNGIQMPMYPKEIMEEAGATYKFPPWQGAWSK